MHNRRLFAELAGNPSCPSGFASANAIGTKKGRANFRDKLLHGVTGITKALAP
jgi:hypothetical protein